MPAVGAAHLVSRCFTELIVVYGLPLTTFDAYYYVTRPMWSHGCTDHRPPSARQLRDEWLQVELYNRAIPLIFKIWEIWSVRFALQGIELKVQTGILLRRRFSVKSLSTFGRYRWKRPVMNNNIVLLRRAIRFQHFSFNHCRQIQIASFQWVGLPEITFVEFRNSNHTFLFSLHSHADSSTCAWHCLSVCTEVCFSRCITSLLAQPAELIV